MVKRRLIVQSPRRGRFARPAYSRAMREVVAKRIIEMAQRGVTDQEKLAADAVRFVSASYVEKCSARIESRKELAVSSAARTR